MAKKTTRKQPSSNSAKLTAIRRECLDLIDSLTIQIIETRGKLRELLSQVDELVASGDIEAVEMSSSICSVYESQIAALEAQLAATKAACVAAGCPNC